MPSSEKVVSPGVFTNEIDQSFLPAAIANIGAAIIGPTVKGPALQPTVVESFGEFEDKFGSTFRSGSSQAEYLTSIAAREYLRNSNVLTVVRILDGSYTAASAGVPTGSAAGIPDVTNLRTSFKLHTLSHGSLLNNSSSVEDTPGTPGLTTPGYLATGSRDNFKWEVSNVNKNKGTFNLIIRRGDDRHKSKKIIESWNNLSLDPNQNNFISKRIGDQYLSLQGSGTSTPYLKLNGDYPIKSKYVRVEPQKLTVDYVDESGNVRVPANSSSLPQSGSGSYLGSFNGGSDGFIGFDAVGDGKGVLQTPNTADTLSLFEKITGTETQGYRLSTTNSGSTAYNDALNLLKNQDEYDFNLLLLPGVLSNESNHSAVANTAIEVCEDRGDCFLVLDPVAYGSAIQTAKTEAETRNSNYAAMYWPWVKVQNPLLGRQVWVPPSTVMGGVYSFNDKVAHPWYAPAGLNRGGLDNVTHAERKLRHSERDDLYESNVNPIATFPGQGVTVWGQKTLQKKSSALDRVNVRRLMIKLKKFIASSSRFLVFEQNNVQTRKRFLNIVNPFLEQVQSQSGLTAFRVIMDDTNNTPDLVDRNTLYGQIFVQPTRTAEFIVLDFTIQPTGATFPE